MKNFLKRTILNVPAGERLLQIYYKFMLRFCGDRAAVFNRFYLRNVWNNPESRSGPGSTIERTERIRSELPTLFKQLGVRTVLDAPCGDYNWFRLISREPEFHYIGADIVEPLIQKNQSLYGAPNTVFITLDIAADPLPSADLWLCRDCLLHLPYRDIFSVLENLLRSDIKYFLFSTHTGCMRNTDIPTGANRALNLQIVPFNFPKPTLCIDDWIEGWKLALWERSSLANALATNRALQLRAKSKT
jgi:hypothetical protein